MSIKNAKNKQVDGDKTANKTEEAVDTGKLYSYPQSGFTIKANSREEADAAHAKFVGQSEDNK